MAASLVTFSDEAIRGVKFGRRLTANDQRRADGPLGGVGSCVRQAARGDDPGPCASTGATRPVAAQRRRAGAITHGERRDDRPNARRREGCRGRRPSPAGLTRQYARLVSKWIAGIGLDPAFYGTHSLRRTKATLIYRRTAYFSSRMCDRSIMS